MTVYVYTRALQRETNAFLFIRLSDLAKSEGHHEGQGHNLVM